MVRAFAKSCDGSPDRSFMVDPLNYFSFQPVLHDLCNKGCGMCYPVCGMMHIKEPLLIIGKSRPSFLQTVRFREIQRLFNNTLNTFYLWLYGNGYIVKDHSDSEKGNPLPPHRLLFPINSKVLLYAPSHRQDSIYHGALAEIGNGSMGPPRGIDLTNHRTMSKRSTLKVHLAILR